MSRINSNLKPFQEENFSHEKKEQRALAWKWEQLFFYLSSSRILGPLLFFVALSFNLYHLGNPSLWFDEILSVERARQPLPVLLQIIWNNQPNMALYYILLHFWLKLTSLLGFNPIEFITRFPSAVFAALSTIVVFLLGRRFLNLIGGIVAAGMYLLNVLELVYAQETRSYAIQLFLICIAWYAFLSALDQESSQKNWWAIFISTTVLAIYTQLFSVLILAAQIVAFGGLLILPSIWRIKTRKQIRRFLLSLVVIFILILPMIYESQHGSKTGWLAIPIPKDIYYFFLDISAYSKTYLLCLLSISIFGITVIVATCLPWRKLLHKHSSLFENYSNHFLSRRYEQWLPIAFALLCWLIIPIILSYIISQGPIRLFSSRYLVTIVPALALMVGLGIGVLRWHVVQIVLAIGVLLLAFYYVPVYYQSAQVEDWNSTSQWLEQQYQTNDGLICYDNAEGCEVCIEYYLAAYPSAAHFTPDTPGLFPWVDFDLTNEPGDAEQAIDPGALAIFGAHHPRIFFIAGRVADQTHALHAQNAQKWLDSHYSFIKQIVTRTVTIRLYSTYKK